MAVRWRALSGLLLLPLLSGCGILGNPTPVPPEKYAPQNIGPGSNVQGSLLGPQGLSLNLLGNNRTAGAGAGAGGTLGVNAYLWRGALDTLSFMPLASADPFGGVIITDWYSPAETPNERFKVNVFILGRELRADGVRCTVFHQRRDGGGQWAEAPVDPKTGVDIENAILTRARQMRLSTASTQ